MPFCYRLRPAYALCLYSVQSFGFTEHILVYIFKIRYRTFHCSIWCEPFVWYIVDKSKHSKNTLFRFSFAQKMHKEKFARNLHVDWIVSCTQTRKNYHNFTCKRSSCGILLGLIQNKQINKLRLSCGKSIFSPTSNQKRIASKITTQPTKKKKIIE